MKLLRTAGALLLTGLTAAACSAVGEPEDAPVPAPTASTSATPAPTTTPGDRVVLRGSAGSDGLTVRYQDRDGSVKTLRVEDFRR